MKTEIITRMVEEGLPDEFISAVLEHLHEGGGGVLDLVELWFEAKTSEEAKLCLLDIKEVIGDLEFSPCVPEIIDDISP